MNPEKPPDQYRAEIIGRAVVRALAAQLDARFGPESTATGIAIANQQTSIVCVRVIEDDKAGDRATIVVDTFYVNAVALYVEAYCTGWRHSLQPDVNPHAPPDAGYGETPGEPPGDFPEEFPT